MKEEFIASSIKNSWGMKCCEDASGVLRFGKGHTGIRLESTFNKETVDKIKKVLENVRGSRYGRFFFDGVSNVVIIDGNMRTGFKYIRVNIDSGKKEKIDPFGYD